MKFDSSFYQSEMRSNFLVDEKRKKVWATELHLLEKFDEVCHKYQLTYYAEYGTLLGAVRHKGFIPWDDDIDVVMFRDDYNKLLSVAADEFTEPYFFQNSYTDSYIWAFSKLRDSRTTAIQFPDAGDLNQGIFIDIFPLDDVPCSKGNSDTSSTILNIQRELWLVLAKPMEVLQDIQNGTKFILDKDILMDLISMDPAQKMKEFEAFALTHFGKSECVNLITDELFGNPSSTRREWYENIVYLPFEYIEIPAPAGYEQILTRRYGDWHQFVQAGSSHEGILLDPDVPYSYYIKLWESNKNLNE